MRAFRELAGVARADGPVGCSLQISRGVVGCPRHYRGRGAQDCLARRSRGTRAW